MSRTVKIVEVEKQAFDKEGNVLDIEGNPIVPDKRRRKIQVPMVKKEQLYLLYWGETFALYGTSDNPVPGHYTVCYCQNIETGEIEEHIPTSLRVIGTEVLK